MLDVMKGFRRIIKFFSRSTRKRVCITTYFDSTISTIGNLSYQSIRRYAEVHGMDTLLLDDIVSDRPPPWNKILVIKEIFMRGYDFVFWIDADAIFVDYSKDIRDIIEENKNLYLVKHTINSQEVPNTGVFLLKNNKWSHRFLDMIWEKQEYIAHKWWENAAVIDIFGYYSLLNENVPDNDNMAILSKVKWLGLEWNSLPNICEVANPIIKHYAARSLDYRFAEMMNDARIMDDEKWAAKKPV